MAGERTAAPPASYRGIFRTDDSARAVYAEAAGIARVIPRAVAVPASGDDVIALVQWAAAEGLPLIPRGSGSGMAGGAVGDGVVVDLSRLAAIGPVREDELRLRAEAGALCGEVDAAARARGLRFPVDPSSAPFCTIGGMISTNAAGAHTLRAGAMRAWVHSLDCVLADGARVTLVRGERPPDSPILDRFLADVAPELLRAERERPAVHDGVRKESSGYALAEFARSGDLVDLVVGSEGTLAIVLAAELRLEPLPGATSSLLGAFPSLEQAVEAAARARGAGAAACELLDRTFLDVAASGGATLPLPAGTEAVLLAELEAASPVEAAGAARALERAFHAAGASEVMLALDPVTEHQLWALRHAASPILSRLDPHLRSMQVVEDGAVPPERLADYVRGVRRALEAIGTRGVIFGHAGDGHVHVNALVDVESPGWHARLEGLLDDVTALTASLGGTLAGEHGDGRLRTPLLSRVWSAEATARFASVKQAFDPAGVLNPGVKVPLEGQAPIGAVKYDPALPPLPADARAALARVERERAYARFRLDLLAETLLAPAARP
jgi:FAD/FMN-containing dehydrogenase